MDSDDDLLLDLLGDLDADLFLAGGLLGDDEDRFRLLFGDGELRLRLGRGDLFRVDADLSRDVDLFLLDVLLSLDLDLFLVDELRSLDPDCLLAEELFSSDSDRDFCLELFELFESFANLVADGAASALGSFILESSAAPSFLDLFSAGTGISALIDFGKIDFDIGFTIPI